MSLPGDTPAITEEHVATASRPSEEQLRHHLDPRDPVFFAETTHWDGESSHDRLWS